MAKPRRFREKQIIEAPPPPPLWHAPTLALVGTSNTPYATVAKSVMPDQPDGANFWKSNTGTGDPTTNPADWTIFATDKPFASIGTSWRASAGGVHHGYWIITNYHYLGIESHWSDRLYAT
jgi:hypothetical protein